jgi:hypothetical protein
VEHSPSITLRRLETDVRRVIRGLNMSLLTKVERIALDELLQNLSDARRYLDSYGLSETREEQINYGKIARKWIARAKKNKLRASETGIFDPADVAHLSARLDHLRSILK